MPRGQSNWEPMSQWVVYEKPRDFPKLFVARRFIIDRNHKYAKPGSNIHATDDVRFGQTLDDVRGKIPPGLYRLDRMPGDDPHIVEVWL